MRDLRASLRQAIEPSSWTAEDFGQFFFPSALQQASLLETQQDGIERSRRNPRQPHKFRSGHFGAHVLVERIQEGAQHPQALV